MKQVLVIGGTGQLGQSLQKVEGQFPNLKLIYLSSKEVDLTKSADMESLFQEYQVQVVINCAAYTAVDKAEQESELAYQINGIAPGILARHCQAHSIQLIHISTDFVFQGDLACPLTESDPTQPKSIYGKSKLAGENAIQENTSGYIILRTSWLYSEFGSNFMKTMLRLSKERDELGVVSDQIGTPTYALDLAEVILALSEKEEAQAGIYHYSNEGVASWYDFAHAIFKQADRSIRLRPLTSAEFPSPAARPAFSVLNKGKIKEEFKISIPHWQDSLAKCLASFHP